MDFKKALEGMAEMQDDANKIFSDRAEEAWSKMTHDEQLMAFYSVVSRLTKGELEEEGSYRYILYDIFGFGPESYGVGMLSGFMDLHNSINREVKKFS